MAADAIGPVIEIVKLLVDPVWRQVDYFWNYKDHVTNLESDEKTLKDEMVKLEHTVKDAEREGKKIEGDVDRWVNKANELIKSAEPFLRNNENEGSENNKCKVIFCSVWTKRYRHGRKAKKMSEKVAELVKDKREKFGNGSIAYNGPDQGTIEPVKDYEEFQSRKPIFKDIMAALRSPSVTKIGVYGINGVGKTTLVRAIAFQAYKEQLVDEVAMATVFQEQSMNEVGGEEAVTPDIKRILDEITDCLKFKLQNKTVNRMADELRKRLKDEKKIKRLIILDDIWVGFKLEDIGIPDDHDGCKILMTSTDEDVLSREMGSKNFPLNLLQPPEALEWFKKMVGDVVKIPAIDQVADKIAKKCDCWPILLVSVANGLKYKKNLNDWESALDQLSNYDKNDRHRPVDLGLRLSFKRLKHDTQQLFLLCGQFPPNGIHINYLLRYSRGMGLFEKKYHTLADTRTRLLSLLSHLKASSLLQEGYDQGILMMHNFVHSFVMSQSENALKISENDSLQWSEVDLEKCTAIYIHCKISELPDELKCPNLNFLLLCDHNSSLEVPEHFFSAMAKLKVLDLTGIDFSLSLPSFESLKNLQTLCLDECKLDGLTNMDIIGQLKNLKILSFRGSNIVMLPMEIKQLSHLQLLDLSECIELEEIPQTLLSGLKRLEDLHMEYICLNWEVEGTKNKLTELAALTNLSTLDIHFANPMLLTMDLFSEKLERFKILIGDHWDWFDRCNSSKTLKLQLNGNVLSTKGVRMLMKKVEELYLREVDVKKTSLREIDGYGFPRLKHLHMEMVHEIAYINFLDRGSSALTRLDSISDKMTLRGSSAAFTALESLYLDNLKDLKKISHGKFIAKSFGNLKVLKVKNCPAIKNLFSTSMANGLSHLEELKISDCETLEEMVIEESENDTDRIQKVYLPQLQKLTLKSLPKFTGFWSKQNKIFGEAPNTKSLFSEKLSCPNLKELKLSSIKMEKIWQEPVPGTSSSSFQNLTSVIVDGCNNLKYLLSFSMVAIVVNLKSLQISNCIMMKEVIVMEGFQEQTALQHLEDLHLENLPELACFCSCNLLKFPALSRLQIDNCPELGGFISISYGGNNVVGTEDDITDSVLFNEKVAFPFPNLNVLSIRNMKIIWHSNLRVLGASSLPFQNLISLSVDGCHDLKYLLPFSMVEIVVNLKSLQISNCRMMKQVIVMEGFQEQTVLQHLEYLQLENLPELECFCSCNLLKFPALISLGIDSCPQLRRFMSNSYGENNAVGTEADMTESVLFDEKVAFPNLNGLSIGNMAKLKIIWHSDLHENSFCKLSSLNISDANELLKIFPSSYAQTRFQNLEYMWVEDCESLEEVFDTQPSINVNDSDAITTTQLRRLFLLRLPNLRHVWTKETLDILSFQNIQSVHASQCPNLKSLFPVSLAKELRELRSLDVLDGGIEEIISKDKEEETEERFEFPQLIHLQLEGLPELKKFYSGRHTVECPALENLHVNCDKVEIFKSEQGHLKVQSKSSLNREPTEGVMITEESTTFSVSAGQASDIAIAENSTALCFLAGQASEISTEEKSTTLVVPGEQVPNNFQATEHSDYGPPSKHETSIKVTIDEQATLTQVEISKLAIPTQDSHETSSLKEDTTQNGLVLHKETHISRQIQKPSQELNQNEQPPDDGSDSFNQQESIIPVFPTAANFFALSTVANSTMSTSCKESNYMGSMPNSETPFQLSGSSFHAPADFESLLASTADLLKQHQEFSYKPSSSSVTSTDFQNSSSASSENYVYSMDLIKKILKKSLTEVARSTDAHHLLINLINLKNSPFLNSHQVEAIQDYIDNFDSLVAHHPSYEQQIDMGTSALVYSIEEKQRSIANLKALYQSSTVMSRTLSETKEALKKMLHETEAEEDRIRASTERVYAELVAKKGELETDVSVLSKAKSRQQEVAEKVRKTNNSWEKLRNLFT